MLSTPFLTATVDNFLVMNEGSVIYQRWERDTRYYEAILQRDFFGWVVTRVWGGRGKKNGRILNMPCDSYDDGYQTLQRLAKRRKKRGYLLITETG